MTSESADEQDIIEAESTILCHIEEFARISRVSDLNKLCKNSVNAADLILDPFLLAVLLTLSCIPAYEVQTMDILRNMFSRVIMEEMKLQDSAWLRNIVNSKMKLEELFSKLLRSKISEHDKVLKGSINLSFLMLSTAAPKGKEAAAKKLWNIGRTFLVSLIKKYRQVTKTVLHTLTDRIITGSSSYQYTDCLFHLCNVTTLSVLDNLPIIARVLEFINQLPNSIGQRIVISVMPLVQISNKLRDNLILTLRKALFSREIGTRQVAVIGFLKLLRFLKLQGLSTLSQNSLCQNTISGPSVFTQVCIEVHSQQTNTQKTSNTNISICLEVLGILKRCFSLQASVKISLYKGLFDAVSVNPELCISVLDILLVHLSQFYVSNISTLPGLQFNKVANIQGLEVILQEPLGRLLLLIQDVLVKSTDILSNEEVPPRSYTKLIEIFTSLVDRFCKCDLNDFNLLAYVSLETLMEVSVKTRLKSVQQFCASNKFNVFFNNIAPTWTEVHWIRDVATL